MLRRSWLSLGAAAADGQRRSLAPGPSGLLRTGAGLAHAAAHAARAAGSRRRPLSLGRACRLGRLEPVHPAGAGFVALRCHAHGRCRVVADDLSARGAAVLPARHQRTRIDRGVPRGRAGRRRGDHGRAGLDSLAAGTATRVGSSLCLASVDTGRRRVRRPSRVRRRARAAAVMAGAVAGKDGSCRRRIRRCRDDQTAPARPRAGRLEDARRPGGAVKRR